MTEFHPCAQDAARRIVTATAPLTPAESLDCLTAVVQVGGTLRDVGLVHCALKVVGRADDVEMANLALARRTDPAVRALVKICGALPKSKNGDFTGQVTYHRALLDGAEWLTAQGLPSLSELDRQRTHADYESWCRGKQPAPRAGSRAFIQQDDGTFKSGTVLMPEVPTRRNDRGEIVLDESRLSEAEIKMQADAKNVRRNEDGELVIEDALIEPPSWAPKAWTPDQDQ